MRTGVVFLLATIVMAQDDEDIPPWKVVPYKPFEAKALVPDNNAAQLIEKLLTLSEPRMGFTSTSGGGVGFSWTDDAYGRLVRMGPAAMPALLKHISDARATKLKFLGVEEGVGGMFVSRELLVPPCHPAEGRRIRDAFGAGVVTDWAGLSEGLDMNRMLKQHVVTIGDCCFSILGEIVNRPYEAVRYQPTLITAVCSPTLEPKIAKSMRACWGAADPRQMLADSLQRDFHTRGWGEWDLRTGAAVRLCLYFPEQGGALVAPWIASMKLKLDKFDMEPVWFFWSIMKTGNKAVHREWVKLLDPAVNPGVLLAALGVTKKLRTPDIERRIRVIFDKTEDADVLLASMEWLPLKPDEIFARLSRALRATEAKRVRGYEDCQLILERMISMDAKKAQVVCKAHMAGGHVRKLTVLSALHRTKHRELAMALAAPLLDDIAKWGGVPSTITVKFRHRRLCDYAALVLARAVDELVFTNADDAKKRDQEIAVMRAALAK